MTTDYEAITQAQRAVWSAGDFWKIGVTVQLVAERLCEAADVHAGWRVLDVACGSGNTALAAARCFCEVTGLDYVPRLLEHGRERAAAEGLSVEFVEGDAQHLPFEDASFDLVTSTFGAMFAPDQQRTAGELLRVTRPGGLIAMANWVPDSIVGAFFVTVTKHAPPPFKLDPPVFWGMEDRLRGLFGDGISELRAERRVVSWRFPSVDFWMDYFRTWFGPTRTAFERVDAATAEAMEADLRAVATAANRADDGTLLADAEYLEVVAVRA